MSAKQLDKLNKQRIKTAVIDHPMWYSETLASALVLYARENRDFARRLEELTREQLKIRKTKGNLIIREYAKILSPSDNIIAWRRAEWLVERINEKNLSGHESAREILTSWVGDKPFESPKQIVIGITIGRIIGPTLGRLHKKVSMSIIIREDLESKVKLDLAQKITRVSHGVLVSALGLVNGNIKKLEPDLADWFFGERKIAFYTTSGEKIKKIEKDLKSLGIVYTLEEQEGEPAILAVSPAVNNGYGEILWGLDRA